MLNRLTDTIDFQNRYRAKDGSYHWIEWTTRAVASEQLLYCAARDITERKLREHYLEVEGEATRVLAESPSSAQASRALLRVNSHQAHHWPGGKARILTFVLGTVLHGEFLGPGSGISSGSTSSNSKAGKTFAVR